MASSARQSTRHGAKRCAAPPALLRSGFAHPALAHFANLCRTSGAGKRPDETLFCRLCGNGATRAAILRDCMVRYNPRSGAMVQRLARSPFKAFQPTRNTALALKTQDLMWDGVGWNGMDLDSVNAIYNAICGCPDD
jgi:hypothetical protein